MKHDKSILNKLTGRVIVFNEGIERGDSDWNTNQKARVERVSSPDEFGVVITLNFKEFAEYNKQFDKREYWGSYAIDSLKGVDPASACLAWHETTLYPTDFRDDYYTDVENLDEFDLVEEKQTIFNSIGYRIEKLADGSFDYFHGSTKIHFHTAEEVIICLANILVDTENDYQKLKMTSAKYRRKQQESLAEDMKSMQPKPEGGLS